MFDNLFLVNMHYLSAVKNESNYTTMNIFYKCSMEEMHYELRNSLIERTVENR